MSPAIADAKRRLAITDLWPLLELPGKPAKSCRSPFRNDRSPSFSVFIGADEFEHWHDHSTGHGGDAIAFLAEARGLTNSQAIPVFLELAGDVDPGGAGRLTTAPRSHQERIQEPGRRVRRIHPESFQIGTRADFKALSDLRGIAIEGLRLASDAGVLRFHCDRHTGQRCWAVFDPSCQAAESRRLDGSKFPDADSGGSHKAHTQYGSDKSWPINAASLGRFAKVALMEGGPDLLGAYGCIWAEGKQETVGVVGMLGAGIEIAADALPLFTGKHIRIFAHADREGQRAGATWWKQLEKVEGVSLSWFVFDPSWTQEGTGKPVYDLNDLCRLSYEDWEHDRTTWGVMP